MTRQDGLGTLPFADYADPDPDALPFDQARADDDPTGRYLSVPSDWCTVCGRYNDEAFHGTCQR